MGKGYNRKGICDMTEKKRYAKPCMINLPPELGKSIFTEILNTPAPDRKKMKAESAKLLKAMVQERDREDERRNSTE